MNVQTAVVIGASGLTGSFVVDLLLKDPEFQVVRVLVRRSLGIDHPKLNERITTFDNSNDYTKIIGEGKCVFCCIGTTRKKVGGDKNLYHEIDYGIPVSIAAAAVSNGFKKFMMVSAIGANETSSNFYLKLKGETENALKKFPFESIGIFRPSILLGNRVEIRPGEKLMQSIMKAVSGLLFGSYKKYRPIYASTVAKAMVSESKKNDPGIHVFEYAEMIGLVSG